jgi:hypothetical protein
VTVLVTREPPETKLSAELSDPVMRVLEAVCSDAGIGPDSEARSEIAVCLASLYANGYFTVEGLRQAFVAYVEREISSSLRHAGGGPHD